MRQRRGNELLKLDEAALRGSIPTLVTPFADGAVDEAAYAGHAGFQVENGSYGIIVEYCRILKKRHDKPWMIYHIPGRATVDAKVEAMKEIDATRPTFIGMKHASLDLGSVCDILDEADENLRIFVGPEERLDGGVKRSGMI